jgi:hypothetical protein
MRNIIDGSLRAMFHEARKAGFGATFPFRELEWPRRVMPDGRESTQFAPPSGNRSQKAFTLQRNFGGAEGI